MPVNGQLVSQHLGKISGTILEDYPELIRSYVKGKHGIYALYRGSRLYYVGQASNLRVRLRHHLKDRHAKKWDRFSIYITTDVEHMRDLESLIIHIAAPQENRLKGGFLASEDLRRRLRHDIQEYFTQRITSWLDGEAESLREKILQKQPGKRIHHTPGLSKLLKANQTIRASYKGRMYTAKVRASGKIAFDGKLFNSPSGAAKYIRKRETSGWHFWKYRNERGNWERLLNLQNKVTAKPLKKTKKESALEEFDTVICPASEEGFREVFMGKNCWYAIRLSGKRIRNIKYIAVYRKRPVSAITHYATVKSIKSYKDSGKFIVKFMSNPRRIGPIHLVKSPGKKKVGPQAPFFSSLRIIKAAKTLSDLWG